MISANDRFVILLVTTPPGEKGVEIAGRLVEDRLAACVNRIVGIESTYRWKGKVEREGEDLLVIKTERDKLARVEKVIESLHPYDVPEMIVIPIKSGAKPYLDWLAASMKPAPHE